jgi:nucleotide-binding universal stress UspA family protein
MMREKQEAVSPESPAAQGPAAAKRVLLAVDNTEGSGRAVSYVADFLSDKGRFHIVLFHVLATPPADTFSSTDERESWILAQEKTARALLNRYRDLLIQCGLAPKKVGISIFTTGGETLAETILKKQQELGSCTIVVGRKGKSRQEEFLFGSVSSRIVREARHCSVWVVE